MSANKGDILIVDDNSDNLKLLSNMLSAAGYKTRPAPSGRMALRALQSISPDLILLDIKMPDMDGYEICNKLKGNKKTSLIPILFISGLSEISDKVKGFSSGAVDYIIKPFQEEEVLARVHTHVSLFKMHKEMKHIVEERTQELTSTIKKLGQEITIRKQTQQKLLQNNKFIESILENIPGIVSAVDVNNLHFLTINRAGENLFGLRKEDLLGKNFHELFPHKVAEEYTEIYREIIKNGKSKFFPEFVFHTKDGNTRYLRTKKMPVSNAQGEIEYVLSVAEDITERKQAKDERNQFLEAVRQSDESIIITDNLGTIQFVNPAFEAMTGFSAKETIGENPKILQSGRHNRDFYKKMWATLVKNEAWHGEITNMRKNGSLFTEQVTISPVLDKKGKIINYIAVKRDITEQRALENQLLHAQKMETIGRLAGGVAHDFNNMLTVIMGIVQLLLLRKKSNSSEIRDLETISTAARRASDITQQLLAFSRKQIISPQIINLNILTQDITKMLKRLLGEDLDIIFSADQNIANVKVDPGQIHQAITNLCINARDAMPDGGTLTIETGSATFDEEYCQNHAEFVPGNYVMLAVSDNGSGIDEEILPHIFEPFFTTKAEGKGTGLGLASVYGTVKQSGGFIHVYTEPGHGTTFKLHFPECNRHTEMLVNHKNKPRLSRSISVLLVEDDDLVRNLTKSMLETIGHNVLMAETPEKALTLCKKSGVELDLLLSDIIMPKISGKKLQKEILHLQPRIKTIFMSGYTANVIDHQGILDQGITFLQKPFSIEDLAKIINEIFI